MADKGWRPYDLFDACHAGALAAELDPRLIAGPLAQLQYELGRNACGQARIAECTKEHLPDFQTAHELYVNGSLLLTQHMSEVMNAEKEPLKYYRCWICNKCATDDHAASFAHWDKVRRF